MKTILLKPAGKDSFGRPIYIDPNGRYYVDIDYQRHPRTNICTKYPSNDPNGEPDHPITGRDFEPRDICHVQFVEEFPECNEQSQGL